MDIRRNEVVYSLMKGDVLTIVHEDETIHLQLDAPVAVRCTRST